MKIPTKSSVRAREYPNGATQAAPAKSGPGTAHPEFFRVSTGLKDIIGRDLITNDFVAIFELVKNAFDARAKRVDVVFLDNVLLVIDNGKGMSLEDVKNKWLFVAYSAKRVGAEESDKVRDYRSKLSQGRAYAGSKGIGRFSCDRLGQELIMYTRSGRDTRVQRLAVNWSDFEADSQQEFVDVPVSIAQIDSFEVDVNDADDWVKAALPQLLPKHSGTVLQIRGFRDSWNRAKLEDLHSHLAKLISPFGSSSDFFQIHVHSPSELAADHAALEVFKKKRAKLSRDDEPAKPRLINGLVDNFVFATLAPRTTFLDVSVVGPNGEWIESTLRDRGTLIYKIREPNPYLRLKRSAFTCSLFYLNKASKDVFARRMGVRSVEFGSVFLFRNGFRVFPIGEPGRDDFGIDHRKQQGYARYLGSRELIGRIEVHGATLEFSESSSRDQGLIRTAAYDELVECFWEYNFKRLERYVTGVTWIDMLDKERLDGSRLEAPQVRFKLIELLAGLAANKNIEILDFGRDVFEILNERAQESGMSIDNLRLLADRVGDPELRAQVKKAAVRYKRLVRAEQQARNRADEEKRAREQAEARATKAEADRASVETAYQEERKRNLFLLSQGDLDKNVVVDLHHQISIYAANLHELVDQELHALNEGDVDEDRVKTTLCDIAFCNEQVLAASRLATRANFRVESEQIEDDLATYFAEYSSRVCSLYQSRVRIEVTRADSSIFVRRFKPIEVSIIVDNLVQNSHRAQASLVRLVIAVVKSVLVVTFADDGCGLDSHVSNPMRIFERGFTTTSGSGLGLNHVKSIVEEMGGSITPKFPETGGASFVLRIPQ